MLVALAEQGKGEMVAAEVACQFSGPAQPASRCPTSRSTWSPCRRPNTSLMRRKPARLMKPTTTCGSVACSSPSCKWCRNTWRLDMPVTSSQ
jgi:hypothetical protein